MFDSHYQYGPFSFFFQWLRKNLNRWEGNIQRLRELDPIAIRGDDYNPTLEYQRQRASNLIQRYVMIRDDAVGCTGRSRFGDQETTRFCTPQVLLFSSPVSATLLSGPICHKTRLGHFGRRRCTGNVFSMCIVCYSCMASTSRTHCCSMLLDF